MKYITEYVWPQSLVAFEGVANETALMREQTLQISLNEPHTAVIHKGGFVLLDFGAELSGGVRILVRRGGKARLRLGESVTEACSEIGEDSTATNDHAVRDAVVELPRYSDQTFFSSGFRFLRIDSLDEELELKSVVAAYTHYAGEQKGTFRCGDARINAIFDTSVRTVMLNLQNGMLWDGIKRDRLVWIGDVHPEMMAATHVYGRLPEIERSLDFARECTPLPEWMDDFPTYSMWWLWILHDYYRLTAAKDFIERNLDYVVALSKQIDEHILPSGELKLDFIFLDWPTHEKPDEVPGVHALALLSMRAAVALCRDLGVANPAAENAVRKLEKTSGGTAKTAKQAIAMQMLAGYPVNAARLTEDGCHGMSTFMSYFILRAVHTEFGGKKALDMLRDYYGGMLSLGATTFWEDFDIDWLKDAAPITRFPREGEVDVHASYGRYCYVGFRHSLCHGWASGPVTYLYRHVLGFEPLTNGCTRVALHPDLGDLKFVDAKIPLPAGILSVHAEAGKPPVVHAPQGVEVVLDKA